MSQATLGSPYRNSDLFEGYYLDERVAALIRTYVPGAVDKAVGFAGFRETATKTNSLVDQLWKLMLPAVDDVRDGLASYMETVERADSTDNSPIAWHYATTDQIPAITAIRASTTVDHTIRSSGIESDGLDERTASYTAPNTIPIPPIDRSTGARDTSPEMTLFRPLKPRIPPQTVIEPW